MCLCTFLCENGEGGLPTEHNFKWGKARLILCKDTHIVPLFPLVSSKLDQHGLEGLVKPFIATVCYRKKEAGSFMKA